MAVRCYQFLPLLAGIAAAVAAIAFSPNYDWESGYRSDPYGGDVLQEWLGGHVLLNGNTSRFYETDYAIEVQHDRSIVGYEWDKDGYLPLVYPPYYYVLVSPLSLIPMRWAAPLWCLLIGLTLGAAAAVLARLIRDALPSGDSRTPVVYCSVAVAVIAFTPAVESLVSGQKGPLLLWILAATFLLLRQERPLSAGCVFGLMAFKPHLMLVIGSYMLIKRQWRFFSGAALILASLLLLTAVVEPRLLVDYVQLCLGFGDYVSTAGYDLHEAHSLWGATQHLFHFADPDVAKALAALGSVVVIWRVLRTMRGPLQPASDKFELHFCSLVVATVLVSPHLFTYDLTILLLPFTLVVRRQLRGRDGNRDHTLLALAAYLLAGYFAPIAAATHVQLSVLLLAILLWQTTGAVGDVGRGPWWAGGNRIIRRRCRLTATTLPAEHAPAHC